eukprot:scaffold63677_cov52-Phaeocystis_antarctica.AAC.1
MVDHGRVRKVDRALEAEEDLHPVEDARTCAPHPLVVAHREAAHGGLQQPEADPLAVGLELVVELKVAAGVARLTHEASRRVCAVPPLLLLVELGPVVGVVAHAVQHRVDLPQRRELRRAARARRPGEISRRARHQRVGRVGLRTIYWAAAATAVELRHVHQHRTEGHLPRRRRGVSGSPRRQAAGGRRQGAGGGVRAAGGGRRQWAARRGKARGQGAAPACDSPWARTCRRSGSGRSPWASGPGRRARAGGRAAWQGRPRDGHSCPWVCRPSGWQAGRVGRAGRHHARGSRWWRRRCRSYR